jgi:hypothetical protein
MLRIARLVIEFRLTFPLICQRQKIYVVPHDTASLFITDEACSSGASNKAGVGRWTNKNQTREEDRGTAEMENNACRAMDDPGRECCRCGALWILVATRRITVWNNTFCFYPLPAGMAIDSHEGIDKSLDLYRIRHSDGAHETALFDYRIRPGRHGYPLQ